MAVVQRIAQWLIARRQARGMCITCGAEPAEYQLLQCGPCSSGTSGDPARVHLNWSRIVYLLVLVALVVASGVVGAMLSTVVHVTPAAAATTTTPVNWTEETCHALAEWERHHDTTSLYRLTVYAAHLPKSYLKADVLELAADVASPSANAWQYVSVADQYAGEDCWGGA